MSPVLNPQGAGLWQRNVGMRSSSVSVVTEWPAIDVANAMQLFMLMLPFIALVVAVKRKDWLDAGALAALVFASGIAIRFLPIADLAAIPLLASALSSEGLRAYAAGIVFRGGAVALVSAYTVVAVPSILHPGEPDPSLEISWRGRLSGC